MHAGLRMAIVAAGRAVAEHLHVWLSARFGLLRGGSSVKRHVGAAIIAAAVGSGCAAPKPTHFENSQTFAAPFEAVWAATVEHMAGRNIPIKTIEMDSGIIYAEPVNAPGTFADCGESIATVVARPATLNIFVRSVDSGTVVTVNTTFRETRYFDGVTFTQECYSSGLIERDILSAIQQRLAPPT